MLDAYRAAGIAAVELGAADVDSDGDLVPRLRSLGLELLVHNYFPPPAEPFVLNLASADADLRRRSLDHVLRALDLTAALGAPFYSVHAGWITDPVGFDGTSFVLPPPESPDDERRALERFVAALELAIDRADALGVELLVENHVFTEADRGKLLLAEPADFPALFRRLEPRRLGLLIDTGHLNVTARTIGFDRLAFVDAVEPYVRAFHVHDNDGFADSHLPVGEGSWVLDVLARRELRASTVVVEARLEDASALAEHVAWLRSRLAAR